jgi:hypothetical protein
MIKGTVPFFKVPKSDRDGIARSLREFTGNDPERISLDLAVTAIKSRIGAKDSQILSVPVSVKLSHGHGLYISLRNNQLPAFTTLAQLQSMI